MAKSGVNPFADLTVSSFFHGEFGGTWTDFTPHDYLPGTGVARRVQRSCFILGLADAVEFLDAFRLWQLEDVVALFAWLQKVAEVGFRAAFGGLERWR